MRVPFFALILALHSFCAGAQTQWEHNGSVMSLEVEGINRVFTYIKPKEGLPVHPGTVLFSGKRVADTYQGTAHVFSQRCGALAYAVSGQVSRDQRSVSMYGRRPRVDLSCRVVTHEDDILIFNLIEPNVVTEMDSRDPTLICLRPVFMEELRLRDRIDGNRATTIWVAQAINHLNAKYCRLVDVMPQQDDSVYVKHSCVQYTGIFRGERVFWGKCWE
jgi:hypothetical protein